jgi:glycerophosphoryl diester phosphodiesterase
MRFIFSTLFISLVSSVTAQIYIPKFDLQGHRGARGLKPENSIPAFLIALDSGVTTIEMDVVITKDKKVLLSHEPWIDAEICLNADSTPIRKTDPVKYNIYKMTYDEVKQFDCGSKPNKRFPGQEKIKISKPLLEDVIVAVETHIKSYSQYEVDYNIEIKSTKSGDNVFHPTPEEFSDLVYNIVDQYLPLERVVIQSFDFRVLKYWHTRYPDVRLAALVENQKSVYRNLSELGFNPSIYSPMFTLLEKEDVEYLQKEKIRVIPWTVNEIEDMKKVKQLGVDGFITDYPDRAASLGLGIKRPRL